MKGLEGYEKVIRDLLEIGLPGQVLLRTIDALYEKGELNKQEALYLTDLVDEN